MSAFLGHIHYWLYRKIQLLVERENLILEKTTKYSSGKHHRPWQYPWLVVQPN